MLISVDDLGVIYRDLHSGDAIQALAGVSLDVQEQEFLSVVGPSGCGKSTLLRAIAGLVRPTRGRILVKGAEVVGPGANRGMVFQDYALLPWKTVRQNIEVGLRFRRTPAPERTRRVGRILEVVGLRAFAEKYPHQLSGGMKQRVAVARVLANEPEVMLMDEPFAAVDAQTRLTLQEELLRLGNVLAFTMILVTHSVEEAVFLGDRVVVLTRNPGRILRIVEVPVPRCERTWQRFTSDATLTQLRDEVLAMVRSQVDDIPADDGSA